MLKTWTESFLFILVCVGVFTGLVYSINWDSNRSPAAAKIYHEKLEIQKAQDLAK
jgi:hypothetical protein